MTVKQKIRKHYGLDRVVTDQEVKDEVAMLKRHKDDYNLFGSQMELYCYLVTGDNPISI